MSDYSKKGKVIQKTLKIFQSDTVVYRSSENCIKRMKTFLNNDVTAQKLYCNHFWMMYYNHQNIIGNKTCQNTLNPFPDDEIVLISDQEQTPSKLSKTNTNIVNILKIEQEHCHSQLSWSKPLDNLSELIHENNLKLWMVNALKEPTISQSSIYRL